MTESTDLMLVASALNLGFEAAILRCPSMAGNFDVVQIHVLRVPDEEQFDVQDSITRKCFALLEDEDDSWQVYIHGLGDDAMTQRILDAAEMVYRPESAVRMGEWSSVFSCGSSSMDKLLSWALTSPGSDAVAPASVSAGVWFQIATAAMLPEQVSGWEWSSERLPRIPTTASGWLAEVFASVVSATDEVPQDVSPQDCAFQGTLELAA